MRVVKLKKSYLKDCETLLRKLGLVKGNNAFPSAVYLAKKDLVVLKNNIVKLATKEYGNSIKRDSCVAMHWLNLGPNEILKDVVLPGYAIIDDRGVDND